MIPFFNVMFVWLGWLLRCCCRVSFKTQDVVMLIDKYKVDILVCCVGVCLHFNLNIKSLVNINKKIFIYLSFFRRISTKRVVPNVALRRKEFELKANESNDWRRLSGALQFLFLFYHQTKFQLSNFPLLN